MSKINISNHPLILSKLTQLRLHDLPPKDFREGIRIIGYVYCDEPCCSGRLTILCDRSMLIYEAARDLPLRDVPDVRYDLYGTCALKWELISCSFDPLSLPSQAKPSPCALASLPSCEPVLD